MCQACGVHNKPNHQAYVLDSSMLFIPRFLKLPYETVSSVQSNRPDRADYVIKKHFFKHCVNMYVNVRTFLY